MKPTYALALFSLAMALVVSACQGSNPLDPPNCRKGTCIRMELRTAAGTPLGSPTDATSTAVGLGQPVTVALALESPTDISDLTILFTTDRPTVVLIDGQKEWKVNVKSRQPLTLSSKVRFTQEGYASLYGEFVTKDYERATISMSVHVTAGGITPNPPALLGGTALPASGTIIYGASPFPSSTVPVVTPTRPPYP